MKWLKNSFSTPQKAITFCLGIFWLFDGILQFQPQMFTKAFAVDILQPNLQSQPSLVAGLIHFGMQAFAYNMFLANLCSALIQIAIGLILLVPALKKYRRLALFTSIAWAIVVWIFGEGMGNLFTGMASLYTGAPGSVVLYLILAVFLLYPNKFSHIHLPKLTGILFIFGGLLNMLPMFWTKTMQTMIYSMSQSDSNKLIAYPANLLSHIPVSSTLSNGIAVVLLISLGALLFLKPTRFLAGITMLFLFIVWWISQDFGGIFTFPNGTATDPNSAPLFMLFLLPLFLNSFEETKQRDLDMDDADANNE